MVKHKNTTYAKDQHGLPSGNPVDAVCMSLCCTGDPLVLGEAVEFMLPFGICVFPDQGFVSSC